MDYEFRRLTLDQAELEKIAVLFQRVWPENPRLNLTYLDWLYRQNPDGKAIGFNAWAGDDLAAHYAVVPFSAMLSGQPQPAALSLNTAVGESHRGQGLFKKLAERTYGLCSDLGVLHVVGIANANSTPGFTRSLGFQLVTSLDVRLTYGRPVIKITKDLQWRRLWNQTNLIWRLRCPQADYWYEAQQSTQAIVGRTKYRGIFAVLKGENDPGLNDVIRKELLSRQVWRPVLWFGTLACVRLPASLPVPEKFRPSPFNLIYRSLQGTSDRLESAATHFEAIDFDVM